jgi:DNA-binding response OmpR family regulator
MTMTVLHIDDSLAVHNLVRNMLQSDSIRFRSAFNGESGLCQAGTMQPDLILLDVDMPDMNGFDVCRFLKADPATTDIPVHFVASGATPDEKICALDLLAADYITKPFNVWELDARIRSALRRVRTTGTSVGEHASA